MEVDRQLDVINQAFADPKQQVENQIKAEFQKANENRKTQQYQQFILSNTFQGTRQGYYFGTGKKGTGYYLDPVQLQQLKLENLDLDDVLIQQQQTGEQLLAEAEDQAKEAGVYDEKSEHLDAKGLKRMINQFQKKYQDNLNLRLKFADDPSKFMESELDLDTEIRNLTQVSGHPHLYDVFVDSGALQDLVNLLTNHENTDIAAEVIEVLKDLTEADVIEEQADKAKYLVDTLLSYGGLEVLVQRLGSYTSNSDDDNQVLFNILSIFENLIEIDEKIATQVTNKTKLLKWLIQRLKAKEIDSTQQYVSEVLAILLHSQTANQQMFSTLGGVEALLRTLAQYRRRNPQSEDEEEYVHNLFDALCSSMLQNENKVQFIRMEGIDLMKLMMHSKVKVRLGVIKVLDFLTTRFVHACERLVDQGCLKYIFAIIMGKSKLPGRKKGDQDDQEELEHTLSIVSNLFQNVFKPSKRDRIAAKFVENEFEKTDRTMELFFQYHEKQVQQEDNIQELIEQEEMSEQEAELTRMEAGQFTLQQISMIITQLWGTGDVTLRKRILLLLHSKKMTLSQVANYVTQIYLTLGEDLGKEEYLKISQRLEKLLQQIGVSVQDLKQQQQVPEQFQEDQTQYNNYEESKQQNGHIVMDTDDFIQENGHITNPQQMDEDEPQTPPDDDLPQDQIEQIIEPLAQDQVPNSKSDQRRSDKPSHKEGRKDNERKDEGRTHREKDRRHEEGRREKTRDKESHKKYEGRGEKDRKGDESKGRESHKRKHEDRGDTRDRHKSSRHK